MRIWAPSTEIGGLQGLYRRCAVTLDFSSWTSSGAMKAYLSGISRHMTRACLREVRKLAASLRRCSFSMTKIMSAHATRSGVSGVSASALVPAEATSKRGSPANICSAVGLRRRFLPQTKRTFVIGDIDAGAEEKKRGPDLEVHGS